MVQNLVKIPDHLTKNQLLQLNELIQTKGLDGIEISYLSNAFGPVWSRDNDYDLGFLKTLTNVKALSLYLPQLKELACLPSQLESLNLGEIKSKSTSLAPIAQLKKLNSLSLNRNTKDISELSVLTSLKEISLTGYKTSQLDFVSKLGNLEDLYLGFGSGKDISFLEGLNKIRRLEILRIRNLLDIQTISNLKELRWLKIEDQNQITALPDLSELKSLKHLSLVNLKNLSDITSLKNSNIQELVLLKSNLTIEQFAPLIDSKINRICISLNKKKDTERLIELLGNRVVPYIETQADKKKHTTYYTHNWV